MFQCVSTRRCALQLSVSGELEILSSISTSLLSILGGKFRRFMGSDWVKTPNSKCVLSQNSVTVYLIRVCANTRACRSELITSSASQLKNCKTVYKEENNPQSLRVQSQNCHGDAQQLPLLVLFCCKTRKGFRTPLPTARFSYILNK